MNNNYGKEIDCVFSIDAINYMRKAIVDAYGNEVYFGINFNAYGILDYIEVMARGNKDSVTAIISLSCSNCTNQLESSFCKGGYGYL